MQATCKKSFINQSKCIYCNHCTFWTVFNNKNTGLHLRKLLGKHLLRSWYAEESEEMVEHVPHGPEYGTQAVLEHVPHGPERRT